MFSNISRLGWALPSENDVLRDALIALGQFAHSDEAAEQEYHETVAAVREGVADMEAGRMRPLREIIYEAKANVGGAG